MKITAIDCHTLLVPNYDAAATSSAQDNLVVVVHTDAGISGVGETDTNPWVARACIEARGTHSMGLCLRDQLLGEDPLQPKRVWEKLYTGSKMTGRRGTLISALGAIDMALWDIAGKAYGQPVYKLLGGACQTQLRPYASLLPAGHTLRDQLASITGKARAAKARGFDAVKIEICLRGPYRHQAEEADAETMAAHVQACREALGPGFTMMVDAVYAFENAKQCLRFIRLIERFDPFFVETPLNMDDLDGHAWLADHTDVPIASGEWQNTHWEFLELADRAKIDVLQPDVGRVGGFTAARRVCDLAEDRGRLIVPHCWKSGIGIAASAHLVASTRQGAFLEFLPAELTESPLRRELVADELTIVNGRIPLPEKPGLGVEVDPGALRKFASAQ